MDEFINIIGNVGFPIFIAMFLLIRVENKIDKLIGAFTELTEALIEREKVLTSQLNRNMPR